MKGLPKFIQEFCLKIVTETIKNRETTNKVRKDLMQYLIQLRNNSVGSEIDDWKINSSGNGLNWMMLKLP